MSTATARLYETDFYGWIQNQANTLRSGNFAHLDLENLIEEIEDMGKSQQHQLQSRLEILLIHLLKWQFQPKRRGASWELSIEEQRRRLAIHLAKNPSLKSRIAETYPIAYELAVFRAIKETKLHRSVFPKQCPWTFEQATNPDFWPEAA